MKVLLIGSGGREHALAWKLTQSRHLTHLFCAPGNPGIARLATCVPIKADDVKELLAFAHDMKIELTVVGPEAPLAAGLVDVFQKEALPVFGPTRSAAQLEASKSFAKTIMRRQGIPTAAATRCTDLKQSLAALDEFRPPYVIKADGLAAGKGVVIAATRAEAERAVRDMMEARVFGAAGDLVLFEEFLEGEELSLFALCDGTRALPMQPAQDHKRVNDGDAGPNTGGMGAYSPVPHLPADIVQEALERVLQPAVDGMAEQGTPYRGLLYAGLIRTPDGGLKVIEFNCRFGDPETQAILPLLQDDLLLLMLESVGIGLRRPALKFSESAAACVVASSGGYPGEYRTGLPIAGLEEAERRGALVFHAGTGGTEGNVTTAGGRVLNVVGVAPTLEAAVAKAYDGLEAISFDGIHYRRDIASRALQGRTARA
ncbi:MAG: phosphoribosylamine--glycine ligase [bacterium]